MILILAPQLRLYGASLASLTMAGALFSHATRIGWSGNAAADMWPLALVALAASIFALITARPRNGGTD